MEAKEEEKKKKGVSQALSSTWQVVDVGHELRCRPSTCTLCLYYIFLDLSSKTPSITGLVGLHEASCKKRWTWFGFPLHDRPWFWQYHLVILSASGGYMLIENCNLTRFHQKHNVIGKRHRPCAIPSQKFLQGVGLYTKPIFSRGSPSQLWASSRACLQWLDWPGLAYFQWQGSQN